MINKYSIPKKLVTDDGETFSSQLLIVECLCIVPYHFYFGAEAATAPIKIITEGRIDIFQSIAHWQQRGLSEFLTNSLHYQL